MKKIVFWSLLGCLTLGCVLSARAFVRYEDKHPQRRLNIHVTGFIDNAPFGFTEHPDEEMRGNFTSIFTPMIDTLAKENNFKIFYDTYNGTYNELVQEVRSGKIDILLGAYHQTELYRGLELIYPAAVNNPITVFMLPNRIHEIKKVEDLRKLKGVRFAREVYSDYVNNQLKQFHIEEADNAYEVFEKLFTKQADYILASHYFGLAQIIQMGLRNQVAIAKQTIWQIPMFMAVSKLSRERKLLAAKITRFVEVPENRKIFQDGIMKMIADFEKKYQHAVAPDFVSKNLISEPEILTEDKSADMMGEDK